MLKECVRLHTINALCVVLLLVKSSFLFADEAPFSLLQDEIELDCRAVKL